MLVGGVCPRPNVLRGFMVLLLLFVVVVVAVVVVEVGVFIADVLV